MFFPIANIIRMSDTIIKNRKILTVDRDRKSSICAESETSYRQKRDIKKEEDICQEIETAQNYPREFQSRVSVPRGQGTRAAPCSKWCCVRPPPSLFRSPSSFLLHHLSLPLSVFPRDWSASPVIHRKHRMQTVTWVVGSKVPRGRAWSKRGRKAEVCACVCVRAVAPGGSLLIFLPLFVALCRGWIRRFRYFGTERHCLNIIE